MYRARICKRLTGAQEYGRFQGIATDRARITKPFKEPKFRFPTWRNRFLSSESIPGLLKRLQIWAQSWNRVIVPARQATQAGGIHSLESIPGLLKRLQIRAQYNLIKVLYLTNVTI
jgi:hypothetical protein